MTVIPAKPKSLISIYGDAPSVDQAIRNYMLKGYQVDKLSSTSSGGATYFVIMVKY